VGWGFAGFWLDGRDEYRRSWPGRDSWHRGEQLIDDISITVVRIVFTGPIAAGDQIVEKVVDYTELDRCDWLAAGILAVVCSQD
jgi:hypothetical protein